MGTIGDFAERHRLVTRLLPSLDRAPLDVQGRVLLSAGIHLAFMIGDWRWGADLLDRSADVNAAAADDLRTAMSLTYAGACCWGLGDTDAARVRMDPAIDAAKCAGGADALVRAQLFRAWLETEADIRRAQAMALEAETRSPGQRRCSISPTCVNCARSYTASGKSSTALPRRWQRR